jgi:hypothetical protein
VCDYGGQSGALVGFFIVLRCSSANNMPKMLNIYVSCELCDRLAQPEIHDNLSSHLCCIFAQSLSIISDSLLLTCVVYKAMLCVESDNDLQHIV